MRYLLLLAFCFAGFAAGAQHLSAGLRTSGNLYLQKSGTASRPGFKTMPGNSTTIAPEVFLRYQGRKSWAAEFALTTDRMQQKYWWAASPELQASGAARTSYSTRSIEAALNLQYEVRCHRLSAMPGLKNLHSFVGIGMSMSQVQQRGIFALSNGETQSQNSEYWYHWISLSKTIRYDVNKHFSLQTGGECGMNSLTMFRNASTPEPALRFSVKLGASYNW